MICQLLPREARGRRSLRDGYNVLVKEVNVRLKFLCEFFPHIDFWTHRRMNNNWRRLINEDGTHLNDAGMLRYYYSVRAAALVMLGRGLSRSVTISN